MTTEVERLAQRLDWLFKTVKKSDGSMYTYKEVEQGTADQGYRVDAGTIWHIRNGRTSNPGYLTVQAIARFFGIDDPRILFSEDFTEEDVIDIARTKALGDPLVEEIALRAATLTERERQTILDMMQLIAKREGEREEGADTT